MNLRIHLMSDLKVFVFAAFGTILSLLLAITIRLGIQSVPEYVLNSKTQIFVVPLIYATALYAFGVQIAAGRRDYALWAVTHVSANTVAWLVSLAFVYLQGLDRIGRGIFLLFGALQLFISLGWHLLLIRLTDRLLPVRRALVVGSGEPAQMISEILRATPKHRLYPVGLLDIDEGKIETSLENYPIYTGSATLYETARMLRADCIILTPPYKRDDDLLMQLFRARLDGLEVLDSGDLYESITGLIPLNHINDYWGLFLSLSRIRPISPTMKRAVDIALGMGLLVVAAPIMGGIALLIKILSPGPIFYRQERLTRNGESFQIFKFRTMVPNAEAATGAVWAQEDDPRITRIGRFLRRWRLDELPQLFNVFRGDMSLVGPRPEREIFVSDFLQKVPVFRRSRRKGDAEGTNFFDGWREAINLYSTRLLVKPGITGWAQVKYPYAASLEETQAKFEYDLYYIKRQSLLFDLAILLRTVGMLLSPNGR